jgi:hypothetical protein
VYTYKFTRHQEHATYAADWEWLFIGSGGTCRRLFVQAKRFDPVTETYGRLAGDQMNLLLKAATANNAVALYCFYNGGPVGTRWPDFGCAGCLARMPNIFGCALVLANSVERITRAESSGRRRALAIRVASIPWSCLVCRVPSSGYLPIADRVDAVLGSLLDSERDQRAPLETDAEPLALPPRVAIPPHARDVMQSAEPEHDRSIDRGQLVARNLLVVHTPSLE